MAKQAGVTKQRIYEVHFGRPELGQQAEIRNLPRRFEARKQEGTGIDDYWCVWDTHANNQAFGSSLTYLTQDDAIARAEELCVSHGPR
jgi:hypothetical protein